ncbi:MAG: hypothetical protein PHT48_12105, partial [Dechloromonas sp.]|nr:hypothetical protein [Dechloromonas sp.]
FYQPLGGLDWPPFFIGYMHSEVGWREFCSPITVVAKVGIGVSCANASQHKWLELTPYCHACFDLEKPCAKVCLMAGPLSNLPLSACLVE